MSLNLFETRVNTGLKVYNKYTDAVSNSIVMCFHTVALLIMYDVFLIKLEGRIS